jgi:hypothetical protein
MHFKKLTQHAHTWFFVSGLKGFSPGGIASSRR